MSTTTAPAHQALGDPKSSETNTTEKQPSESFISTSPPLYNNKSKDHTMMRSHSDDIQATRLKSYHTLPTITTTNCTHRHSPPVTMTNANHNIVSNAPRPLSWDQHSYYYNHQHHHHEEPSLPIHCSSKESKHPLHIIPSWRTEPVLSQSSSTATASSAHPHQRRPDLGDLNSEEQETLKAEITQRRVARRVSKLRRRKTYADEDDHDDDRVVVGTRVAEGHRNYPLM